MCRSKCQGRKIEQNKKGKTICFHWTSRIEYIIQHKNKHKSYAQFKRGDQKGKDICVTNLIPLIVCMVSNKRTKGTIKDHTSNRMIVIYFKFTIYIIKLIFTICKYQFDNVNCKLKMNQMTTLNFSVKL